MWVCGEGVKCCENKAWTWEWMWVCGEGLDVSACAA